MSASRPITRIVGITVLAAGGVLIYLRDKSDFTPLIKKIPDSETATVPYADGDRNNSNRKNNTDNLDSSISAKTRIEFSTEEENQISSSVARILERLNKIEVRNAKIEQQINSEFSESLFLTISPFSDVDNREVNDAIAGEIKLLTAANLKEEFLKRSRKNVTDFTIFPKPFKFVQIFLPKRAGTKGSLTEYYADSPDKVRPDQFGMLKLEFDGSLLFKEDTNFGSENSWASKRYSHLAALDPIK